MLRPRPGRRADDGRRTVVTVYEGRRPETARRPCPEIAVFKRVVVRTPEPIDAEGAVDGAA